MLDECCIILVGKTGAGKSASGNTILGETAFPVEDTFYRVTEKCSVAESSVRGRRVKIVDTPGLCSSDDSTLRAEKEIAHSVFLQMPGPHAVLYVVSLQTRFTEDEYNCYRCLKHLFGASLTDHLILLLTHGDCLANEGVNFPELLETAPSELLRMMEECNFRYIIFDNTSTDVRQVDHLLDLVARVKKEAENKGMPQRFTSDLDGLSEEALETELALRMKEAKEQETRRERFVSEYHELQEKITEITKSLEDLREREQQLFLELPEEENIERRRSEAVRRAEYQCSNEYD